MLLPDSTVGKMRDAAFTLRGACALYRQVSQTLNPKTGVITAVHTDTSVKVLRSGDSKTQSIDSTFRVRMCELPSGTPRIGDRVVYDQNEYIIHKWVTDQSRYVVDLQCRKA